MLPKAMDNGRRVVWKFPDLLVAKNLTDQAEDGRMFICKIMGDKDNSFFSYTSEASSPKQRLFCIKYE